MVSYAFLAVATHRVTQLTVRCSADQQDPSVVLDIGEVTGYAFSPAGLVPLAAAGGEACAPRRGWRAGGWWWPGCSGGLKDRSRMRRRWSC